MVGAMLTLAAESAWEFVTFDDIVAKAGVDSADAREYFDDKLDVIVAYGRQIDRRVLEAVTEDENLSCRDKLFDLLMERFDVLNENRAAVISMLHGFRSDPKDAVLSFPHLGKSMCKMLEGAGIETDGISGAIKVAGLMGIYLYAVRTWKEDDSPDMAKTMATIDKSLDKAESLYNSLPINSSRHCESRRMRDEAIQNV